MIIIETQTFIRPSTDVLWFKDTWPETHMEYINTVYKNTGKLSSTLVISEDGLTMYAELVFSSQSALDEFSADVYLVGMLQDRDVYNYENNILMV
jgi:hypothetical protein